MRPPPFTLKWRDFPDGEIARSNRNSDTLGLVRGGFAPRTRALSFDIALSEACGPALPMGEALQPAGQLELPDDVEEEAVVAM